MLRGKRTIGGKAESRNVSARQASRIERSRSRLFLSVAYTVTDLGSLGGGDTAATAINNAGQITGASTTAQGIGHIFLWSNGKMHDLGTLVPGVSAQADAINSKGDVAGFGNLSNSPDSAFHPLVIHNGSTQDLGVLPGHTSGDGQGINSAGQVVGYLNNGDPSADEAFVYSNGKLTDLDPQIGGVSNAFAINDAGKAVGYGTGGNGNPEAFVYSNGKATFLGMPSFDNYDTADAINSTGTEIVGQAGLYLQDDSAAFVYKNGTFTSFFSLSPFDSEATGVNASGVVVGNYEPVEITATDSSHAWVYPGSGSPEDLTDLIDPSLGVKLDFATGINDAGQIIASGMVNGKMHAYLLNPVAGGSISGTLFNDLNGDGIHQSSEAGLAGRTVYIDANHNGILDPSELSAVTDAGGHYAFTGLAPGTYAVSEVPRSDWHTTVSPANVKLAAGQNIVGANIGNQQFVRYSITDIANAQLVLEVTGFNAAGEVVGDYLATDASGNSSNHGFLFSNNHLTVIGSNSQSTSGLTINAAGQVNGLTTDAKGNSFYFVYSNGKLLPAKQPANYGSVMNDHGDFGGAFFFGGGRGPSWTTAYVDINGKNTVLGQTDDPNVSSGITAINDLDQALGNGQLTVNGPIGAFIYSNGQVHWLTNVPVLANDLNDNGQIVGTLPATEDATQSDAYVYTGGQVVDLNDAIPANSGFTLTSADYINDSGAIVADATDGNNQSHLLLLTPIQSSVSGSVFDDVNHDGKQQTGEPSLQGIRVYADINGNHRWDPGEPFALTNAAGQYTIAGVPTDGVVIRQVLQPGWTQISPANGNGTWADLSPGQNIAIQSFAQSPMPASVSGLVFNDANGDGIREGGESGVAGVLVYVDLGNHHQFQNGDPFAITDSSGDYTITGLQPGNFVIRLQTMAGTKLTTPTISGNIRAGQDLLVSAIGVGKG